MPTVERSINQKINDLVNGRPSPDNTWRLSERLAKLNKMKEIYENKTIHLWKHFPYYSNM